MRSLFPMGLQKDCKINRIKGEATNLDVEAGRYGSILPQTIDVMLLSVGPDGHIASLFPGSIALSKTLSTSIILVIGPKLPPKRLTITEFVIKSAREVYLLGVGLKKGQVLAEALKELGNITNLPVRLILGGTWLLGSQAAEQFQISGQHQKKE